MGKAVAAGVAEGKLGRDEAKAALSTSPVHRVNGSTLVSLVFEPQTRTLNARFRGDDSWISTSLEAVEVDAVEEVAASLASL